MVTAQNTYTIMIRDDEEDILTLYTDYLSNMGHRTQSTYVNADSILRELVSSPRHLHHRL
jgi:DNA-binding NtrC family response regulator